MTPIRDGVRNVWLLAAAQALFMSTAILTTTIAAIAAIAARGLLDRAELATLPQAMVPLVAMATSVPAATWMARRGRRAGFLIGALTGIASGVLCAIALQVKSYPLFLGGAALLGVYQGFATYYRSAVADEAPEHLRARSISCVLAGGVVAAVAGPTLTTTTASLVPGVAFMGSYLAVALVNLLAFAALASLRLAPVKRPAPRHASVPLAVLFARPRYLLAGRAVARPGRA